MHLSHRYFYHIYLQKANHGIFSFFMIIFSFKLLPDNLPLKFKNAMLSIAFHHNAEADMSHPSTAALSVISHDIKMLFLLLQPEIFYHLNFLTNNPSA